MDLQSAIARYNRLAELSEEKRPQERSRSGAAPVQPAIPQPTRTSNPAVNLSLPKRVEKDDANAAGTAKIRRLEEAQELARKYARLLQQDPATQQGKETIEKAVTFYSFNESRLEKFRHLIASFES